MTTETGPVSTGITAVVVYLLTAYAAAVVVLTRLRLRDRAAGGGRDVGGASRVRIARTPARVHAAAGVGAVLVWLAFLVGGDRYDEAVASLVGIVALLLWWITALVGLLLLARWLPARGRHASRGTEDGWSRGPALSLVGHGGVLVAVLVFTWAYLVSAV